MSILLLGTEFALAQNFITDSEVGDLTASEGDLYEATPSGTVYIGLANGAYHAIAKGNIYTDDGVLTGNRIINGTGNFNVKFEALDHFDVYTKGEIRLTADTYTILSGKAGIIMNQKVQFIGALTDKDWESGTLGQILSSTGTNIKWIDNPSGKSIYTHGGTLTSDRELLGASYNLSFENVRNFNTNVINRLSKSLSSQFLATNKIELKSSAGNVEIAAPLGIELQNNTSVTGNLSVTGSYSDSSTDTGNTGDILSSTGTATGTDWHPLISTDPKNAVTMGTDKGVFVKKNTIKFLSKESTKHENWGIKPSNNEDRVASHTVTLEVASIVNINYIFTFERTNGTTGAFRTVHIDISGDIIKTSQMSTLTNTFGTSERWGTCAASRSFKLAPGEYTFSMNTYGSHPCTTEAQNDLMYGWSFDITATPLNE